MTFGTETIFYCTAVWIACVVYLNQALWKSSRGSVGLPLAYVFFFTLIHVGAVLYLIPGYDPNENPYLLQSGVSREVVSVGFFVSTVGMVGFTLGVFLCEQIGYGARIERYCHKAASSRKLAKWMIISGTSFFLVIKPIASLLPSGASISTAGIYMGVTGLCLAIWNARWSSNFAGKFTSLVAPLLMPAMTMLFWGFVGYAVNALMMVLSFVIQFTRVKFAVVLALLPVLWLGLTFYTAYMKGRQEMRQAINRDRSIVERAEVTFSNLVKAEPFNPLNPRHLYPIDIRLNQNTLVGQAVGYMSHWGVKHAYGETMMLATVAWIPRAIWPNKPSVGGSGNVVSSYTGRTFSRGTSVGVGQVLEFYINFGTLGVLIGFFVMGCVLRAVDIKAIAALGNANPWGFAKWHLPAICAIQPQGISTEIVASTAAAIAIILLFDRVVFRRISSDFNREAAHVVLERRW